MIRKGTWEQLPIFEILQAKGGVPEEELYQVFNMGIGMVVLAAADQADAIKRFITSRGHRSWLIGAVEKGTGKSRVV